MRPSFVLLLISAVIVALTGDIAAQSAKRQHKPRLRVAQDREFLYELEIEAGITQSVAGQEITVDMEGRGTGHLHSDAVERDRIIWSFRVPELAMKIKGAMIPDGGMDTIARVPIRRIVTDREGRTMEDRAEAIDDGPAGALLQTDLRGGLTSELFSPVIAQKAKPGNSWTVEARDTTENANLSMRRHTVTRYTYDGLVDTLGHSTMRVRSSLETLTIEGSLQAQGMEMKMDGDGGAAGVFYHDAVSGVLVFGASDAETQMRMTMAGQVAMVVPMVTRTRQVTRLK